MEYYYYYHILKICYRFKANNYLKLFEYISESIRKLEFRRALLRKTFILIKEKFNCIVDFEFVKEFWNLKPKKSKKGKNA